MSAQTTKGRHIGDLAAAAGVSVDTLRYYEREGLLPKPGRTDGGFRVYAPESVQRIRFIKQAQGLGLSLREIRQLIGFDRGQCASVRDVIAKRLADVDARLEELRSFRKMLRSALKECETALRRSTEAECPVVPYLGSDRRTRA